MSAPAVAMTPVAALALVPRSGRWRFVPQGEAPELAAFDVDLSIAADGTIAVTTLAPRHGSSGAPMPESYLKGTGQGETMAYLMLDRLYRMRVVTPTRLEGEAWSGVRPPQVVPIAASWLGPGR